MWTQFVLTVSTISGSWHSNDPRPSPNFSPWLRDKIWEWPGDKAIMVELTYLYVQKNVLITFQAVYQTCSLSYGLSIFTLQYYLCWTLGLHDLWPPFREWYHPSAILLSATLSQRVISALYDLCDVDFDLPVEGIDLDELWPSFVLWVDPSLASHTLCRE